jgi:PAS domain-containing protein
VDRPSDLPPPGPDEASGAVLGDVLGQLAEGVAVVDASGRLRYANAEALRIMGLTGLGQLPGSFPELAARFDVRDPDGEPVPVEQWPAARVLAGERVEELQFQFVAQDGVARWVRCTGGPVELDGGETGAWVSFRDVGREETILRELREERDLVTALVDMSPLAVAVARAPDMVVELANDVAKALRPDKPVGRRWPRCSPRPGRPASSTCCCRWPRPARRWRSRTPPWSGVSRAEPAPSP